MIKYVWHVAALMIVFCWLPAAIARSTAYNHINGLGVDPQLQAQAQQQQQPQQEQQATQQSTSFWKDLSLVYRIYQQCTGENMSVCLKVKLLTGLEKAFRTAKTLTLFEGIQFVSSSTADKAQKRFHQPAISEQDIEAVLPRGIDAKDQVLNSMIMKRLGSFLQDHTLQVGTQ